MIIYQKLESYSQQYPEKFKLIKNLGQKAYLSAMNFSELMVGNSSSGILESASFKLPVLNIGDRQGGRFKPINVVDCVCSQEAITNSINKVLSHEFKQSIAYLESPFGDGDTSTRIVKVLETVDFNNKSEFLKKGFYELNHDLSQVNLQRVI